MARTLSGIQHDIDQPSPAERSQLLRYLIEKLDAPADTDVEAAWLAESERRLDEYAAGKVRAISVEAVMAEARSRSK